MSNIRRFRRNNLRKLEIHLKSLAYFVNIAYSEFIKHPDNRDESLLRFIREYFSTLQQIEHNLNGSSKQFFSFRNNLDLEFGEFVFGKPQDKLEYKEVQPFKSQVTIKKLYADKQSEFSRNGDSTIQPADSERGENPILERV